MKKEYTDTNTKIEAEFVSEALMADEWGWSANLCHSKLHSLSECLGTPSDNRKEHMVDYCDDSWLAIP